MWSPKYGAHIDAPKPGMFAGSEAQKLIYARNFDALFFGKRADGTDWHMPKESLDGIKAYKAALQAEKGLKPTGTLEAEQCSHSCHTCPICFALSECTQDDAYTARVNMLISPSQATVKAGLPESVAAKPIVPAMGAGAIAEAAEAVAAMAVATSRAREETPVGGERQVSVLLDTGAGVGSQLHQFQACKLADRTRIHYAQ